MARGRAAWKQALDIKPHMTRLFGGMETNAPYLTQALRYYSRTAPVDKALLFEDFSRPLRLDEPRYTAANAILSAHNVDGMYGERRDVHVTSAMLEDYFVTGHTLYPISRETSIVADHKGIPLPWGITYPSPSWRGPIRIPGVYMAVPHIKNYYHLLVDFLMPVMSVMVRNPARFSGPFTFVVNHASAAVDFAASLLRDMGFDARIRMIGMGDTVTGDQYLWAKTKGGSTEHGYAFRPEMDVLGPAIERRIAHIHVPKKVYIPRTATKLRNLLNQNELMYGLAAKGFATVKFDWMNLLEQIAVFRHAEQIVSVHGAALTNMAWGTQSSVREIFPNNARKTTYLHIGSQNDWAYAFHLGSDEMERQNFLAPVDEILSSIA